MPSMVSLQIFGCVVTWFYLATESKGLLQKHKLLFLSIIQWGAWRGRAKSRHNWKMLRQVLRSHKISIPTVTCRRPFLPLATPMQFTIKS